MNRRFYCAVGVASGVLLLGGGVAQAGATALEAGHDMDPMAMRGLPTDIFTPTRGQYRLSAPIATLTERANSATPGRGQVELQPNAASTGRQGVARTERLPGGQAGRTEGLIPGLGGNSAGPLLGLLSGLPGGGILGSLTGEASPLGQLLSGGPLGSLLGGGKKAPTDDANPAGAVAASSPRTQNPAFSGGNATDSRPATPAATGPGMVVADPAANGAWQPAAPAQPSSQRMDDTATHGDAAGEAPAGADSTGGGLEEKLPFAGGNPLTSGMLGPNGPLSRVELLGGDTLVGLPLVGDLLRGGLNLNTLNNLPGLNDLVNRIGPPDADKTSAAPGNLQTVGKLSRMLLNGESTTVPAESTGTDHRAVAQRTIDKTKVTPELLPLFGHDALDVQAPNGMIHQLPPVG